jgi:hypothetical protein
LRTPQIPGLAGNNGRLSIEMVAMIVALDVSVGAIPAFSSCLPAFFALVPSSLA